MEGILETLFIIYITGRMRAYACVRVCVYVCVYTHAHTYIQGESKLNQFFTF